MARDRYDEPGRGSRKRAPDDGALGYYVVTPPSDRTRRLLGDSIAAEWLIAALATPSDPFSKIILEEFVRAGEEARANGSDVGDDRAGFYVGYKLGEALVKASGGSIRGRPIY